jgi:hypothetical protein
MNHDPDLVDFVRQTCSHPVTGEQARAIRRRVVRDGVLTAAFLLALGVYAIDRKPGLWSVLIVLTFTAGRNMFEQYRVARPREATPVPEDVLAWALRGYSRCRPCQAIVRPGTVNCPTCGILVVVSPGFWAALGVALLALVGLLWWALA